MAEWRELLMPVLRQSHRNDEGRLAFLEQLENWSAKADTDDTGYRLIREYVDELTLTILSPVGRYFKNKANLNAADNKQKAFDDAFPQLLKHDQEMILRLLEQQPDHWLSPEFVSWNDLQMQVVDRVVEKLGGTSKLATATWGQRNTASIQHPLSKALPGLSYFLDQPAVPLYGDIWMPRAQRPSGGVSERMAVAPGQEEKGIFHMPGSQSAHPLSPYFQIGFEDWLEGRASSFLPEKAYYSLTFQPVH